MEVLKVVIAEDDSMARSVLRNHIRRLPELEIIAEFDQLADARTFLQKHPADLLLLDLHLPDGSGFGLLDTLPRQPDVILTTASISDSLQAFDYGVIDYLVKPIQFPRFQESIRRLLQRRSTQATPSTIILKDGRGHVQFRLDEILYVSAEGAFSLVHLPQKKVLVSHLLSELEEKLPSDSFIRVHRSYIIGVAHISRLSMLSIEIGNKQVPVGVSYRETIKKHLK